MGARCEEQMDTESEWDKMCEHDPLNWYQIIRYCHFTNRLCSFLSVGLSPGFGTGAGYGQWAECVKVPTNQSFF